VPPPCWQQIELSGFVQHYICWRETFSGNPYSYHIRLSGSEHPSQPHPGSF